MKPLLSHFPFLALALFLCGCNPSSGIPVTITENQINSAMAKAYPVNQTLFRIIDLTYANPKVFLRPGSDQVELRMDAELGIGLIPGARKLTGTTTVLSGIRYQPTTGQFFLADPEIREVDIEGIPRDRLELVTKAALELTRSKLEATPIYTFEGNDTLSNAAKLLVKDVRIQDGAARVQLGW